MSNYHVGVDEAKPKGWKKKFQGYFDPKKKKTSAFPENCEYVIEKLAVKCLRSSVIAISTEDLSEPPEPQVLIPSETSSSSVEQPPKSFSKSIKKLSSLPKKFSIKQSKNINIQELNSIPSSSSKPSKKIQRKTEIINRFTAFHPDLKESERPPKEPLIFKLKKNKRFFAEELSEIASRNDKMINTNSELENETILGDIAPSTSDQLST
ncbi:uncharacterized protein [Chelonus insularis]|uniref:uncharacterized protein n=1 Tax=Chelonus insularis TaxID=460826 RepID=UPI00158A8707|nr:uncharacterized protein LOC118065539 [Chelonus insularis]